MTQGQLPLTLAPETGTTTQETIATECRAPQDPRCPFCGGPVTPQKPRRGRPKVYCSEECQQHAWQAEHPRVTVPKPGKGPTRGQRILDRLRQGPATGLDLLRAGGGTRYSARISELRKAGHLIFGPQPWKRWITEHKPEAVTYAVLEERTTEATPEGYDVYRLEE